MKKLLIATSALTLAAMPANAQLLGNGSLTGGLGSALDLGTTISRTTETINSTTRGAVHGNAATDGEQSVDRRSGRVEARRNADIAGAANVTQLANTPILPIGATASGNGSASGEGQAQAQLIGTDAVQSAAGTVVAQGRGTAQAGGSLAAPLVGQARGAATSLPGTLPMPSGSATGEGSASGDGSASLMSAPLAVAGSAAGAAQGAAAIAPGMPVMSPEGLPIGEVSQIVANSRGEVEQVLVTNGGASQLIPAGNLSASGNALVAGSGAVAAETDGGETPAPEDGDA